MENNEKIVTLLEELRDLKKSQMEKYDNYLAKAETSQNKHMKRVSWLIFIFVLLQVFLIYFY